MWVSESFPRVMCRLSFFWGSDQVYESVFVYVMSGSGTVWTVVLWLRRRDYSVVGEVLWLVNRTDDRSTYEVLRKLGRYSL